MGYWQVFTGDIAMYGIMYGVKRTTVYLPDEMKDAIEREAARRGTTEAAVIRGAVTGLLERSEPPVPQLPVFPEGFGEDIAGRVNQLLAGAADDILADT